MSNVLNLCLSNIPNIIYKLLICSTLLFRSYYGSLTPKLPIETKIGVKAAEELLNGAFFYWIYCRDISNFWQLVTPTFYSVKTLSLWIKVQPSIPIIIIIKKQLQRTQNSNWSRKKTKQMLSFKGQIQGKGAIKRVQEEGRETQVRHVRQWTPWWAESQSLWQSSIQNLPVMQSNWTSSFGIEKLRGSMLKNFHSQLTTSQRGQFQEICPKPGGGIFDQWQSKRNKSERPTG